MTNLCIKHRILVLTLTQQIKIVLEVNERVQGLNNNKQKIKGGTPQRGHSRFNTVINTNAEELQHINTSISVTNEYLKNS